MKKKSDRRVTILLKRAVNDLKWLDKHYGELVKKYNNKFVAIKEGKILTTGSNFKRVVKRLREMNEEPSEILVEYIRKDLE